MKLKIFISSLILYQGICFSTQPNLSNNPVIHPKLSLQKNHSLRFKINLNENFKFKLALSDLYPVSNNYCPVNYSTLLNPDSASVNSNSASTNYEYVPEWYSMFTNLPGDMIRFYHQEFRIDRIPVYLSIAALTAVLIATDDHTWRQSDQIYHSSNFVKTTSDVFVAIGDGRSQFGLAAIFASYGLIAKDNRALTTGSQIVEAVLASGAVAQLLKHITGRQSPISITAPGGKWQFFPNQKDYLKHTSAYDAFPSGHLTTALAAFTVVAENYPEQKWIKPVTYTVCALLGVGMVNQGIHWYSDYPLAIAIGYGFGKLIAHPQITENTSSNNKGIKISILPYFNFISKGLQLSLSF